MLHFKSSKIFTILIILLIGVISSTIIIKFNKYHRRFVEYKTELSELNKILENHQKLFDQAAQEKGPSFSLLDAKQNIILNKNYEFREQSLLFRFLDKDDIVLQLGGNIGTSCIFADKLLNKKDKQLCVEPNNQLIEVLSKNKDLNNAKFNIINGLVSNKRCAYKKSTDGSNLEGTTFVYSENTNEENTSTMKCYDYSKLEEMIDDKINVLFLDCEGCACEFLSMYENVLPDIKTVLLETDQSHLCNYKEIVEPILKRNNFKQQVKGFHQVWIKELQD